MVSIIPCVSCNRGLISFLLCPLSYCSGDSTSWKILDSTAFTPIVAVGSLINCKSGITLLPARSFPKLSDIYLIGSVGLVPMVTRSVNNSELR